MIGSSIVSSTEDGLDKLAKHARSVLVVLAVVQLAGSVILYFVGAWTSSIDLGVGITLGVVFGGLSVWALKNPLLAVVVGLGIWGCGMLLTALIDPASLFSGWIAKAVILAMFWNGISTGITYNEMKRTLAK